MALGLVSLPGTSAVWMTWCYAAKCVMLMRPCCTFDRGDDSLMNCTCVLHDLRAVPHTAARGSMNRDSHDSMNVGESD